MGQGQPRIKLNFGHTKNVLTRSILGVVRLDCAGLHPATSSRRRRPPRRPPPPSGTPFPPIPARYRQQLPPPPRSRRNSVRVDQVGAPPTRPGAKRPPGTSKDARNCRARAPGAIIAPAALLPRKIKRQIPPYFACNYGGITTARAARMYTRVIQREQAVRGLPGGGRDLFLRALVVENDDDENKFYRIELIFHQN